nr:hypothetical protein [Tanacetum cinerariifolium]
PVKLIFSTPPTSPHPFFDSLEDLLPRTTNTPPPQPTFDSIKHLANQPSLVPDVMEPPLPPLPPQLPLMWTRIPSITKGGTLLKKIQLNQANCPSDRVQPSGGYNAVPPPITGNFMPLKPDLVFNTAPIVVETAHSAFTVKLSSSEPIQDLSHTNRPSVPIIEEWVSDFEDDYETTAPQIVHTDTPKPTSPKTSSSGKRKNRKTCFLCRSVDHLIKDCTYHTMKKAQPTPRNYVHMGTHKQNASFSRHHLQMHMVPAALLTQSKPISTVVRPICVAVPKIIATKPRHARSLHTKTNSRHKTPSKFSKTSNLSPKVTAAQALVVSAAKGKKGKWIEVSNGLGPQKILTPHLQKSLGEEDASKQGRNLK